MSLYLKYRPNSLEDVIGNDETIQMLKGQLNENSKQPLSHSLLFHGPTGCGKTTLGRIIAKELGAKGSDVREIDSADFRGIDTIREIRKQSTYRPLESPCRVWILDECFAKGTKIRMLDGMEKPIEEIQTGEQIQNFYKGGTVTHTFQNKVELDRVLRIMFSDGSSLVCSKEHLFLTASGWKKASDIHIKKDFILSPSYNIIGDKGLRQGGKRNETDGTDSSQMFILRRNSSEGSSEVLLQDLLQPGDREEGKGRNQSMPDLPTGIHGQMVRYETNVLEGVREQISRTTAEGEGKERRNQEKNITSPYQSKIHGSGEIRETTKEPIRSNERSQSHEQPEEYRKNDDDKKNERDVAYLEGGKRRQRKTDSPSDAISNGARMGNGTPNSYGTLFRPNGLSDQLQSRHSESITKISDRSGWEGSPMERAEAIRQEERGEINFVRVESIEVYERGNNDGSFHGIIEDKERDQGYVIFYDLEIDSHPSYIANGKLVHNCHKMTGDAQTALLKALEDTPSHVYYILCTTDPQKLLPTIRGRCAQYQVQTLSDKDMKKLLRKVVKGEEESLSKEIYEQIAQDSMGHPRNALQILTQVLSVEEDKRMKVAQRTAETQSKTIELCRALITKEPWKKIAGILKGLKEEEPEQIRRAVLGYCQSILLGDRPDPIAAEIMEEFIDPFFNSGFPGLTFACYSVLFAEDDEEEIPF